MTAVGIVGSIKNGYLVGWVNRKSNDDHNQLVLKYNSKSFSINDFHARNDVYQKGLSKMLLCGFQIKISNEILHHKLTLHYFDKKISLSESVIDEIKCKRQSLGDGKKVIFIHIPKTAGTSLRHILYENNIETIPSKKQISGNAGHYLKFKNIIKEINASIHNKQAVFGHYPYSFYKSLDKTNYRFFTVIRDPIDRSISNLLHLKSYNPNFFKMSLSNIIKHAPRQVENTQTRFLCSDNIGKSDIVRQIHLEQALSNIPKFEAIGYLKNWEQFCTLFLDSFGVDSSSIAIDKKLNKRKLNVDKIELNEIEHQLQELNSLDLILYNSILSNVS